MDLLNDSDMRNQTHPFLNSNNTNASSTANFQDCHESGSQDDCPHSELSLEDLEIMFTSLKSDQKDHPFKSYSVIENQNIDKLVSNLSISKSWDDTLEKVIKAIVQIKTRGVKAFDTEFTYNSFATGFIVDSKNGIILSNRHVVGPGPTVSQAIFYNYETVDLLPIYYDPIHDFGFFKFNPENVKFTQINQITLASHKARVGLDIRVVGNDNNEKLSIASGTLARLDRPPPEYGIGNYNDMNTFYFQASTGTSGGSSGSPVLDIHGDAVALNAGSSNVSDSSFYLPLNQIEITLKKILNNEQITRGTLQVEFEYTSYDKLKRLGLPHKVEKIYRENFPNNIGMFIVKSVLPEGPADNILFPGDILIAINSSPITHFLDISFFMDNFVNKNINVSVLRNKSLLSCTCTVQDLFSITTTRLVEFGGGVVHDLSYQAAKGYNIPVRGVFVSSVGYTLGYSSVQRYHIIISINNRPIKNIDDFVEVISTLSYNSRVPIKHYLISQSFREIVSTISITSDWFPYQMATRNPKSGIWEYKKLSNPKRSHISKPLVVNYRQKKNIIKPADIHTTSVVYIEFDAPFVIETIHCTKFYGPGYIIDKDQGLVLCDRNTVMISAGNVFITFANSTTLPASVYYLHPVHNITILKYNPDHIVYPQLKNLQINPEYYSGKKKLNQGDPITIVSFDNHDLPIVRQSKVSYTKMLDLDMCSPPRWRAINTEVIYLEDDISKAGGILCDESGLVVAILISYSFQNYPGNNSELLAGLELSEIKSFLDDIISGNDITIRSLDVIMAELPPYLARSMGMSEEILADLEEFSKGESKFFKVNGVISVTSEASKSIKIGDIFTKIDDEYITNIRQISMISDKELVKVELLRDGEMKVIDVPTTILPNIETTYFLEWAGTILQKPHRPVHEFVKKLPSEIYILFVAYGTPADSYDINPRTFITHVEGIKVHTIFDFIKTLKLIAKQSPINPDSSHTEINNVPSDINNPNISTDNQNVLINNQDDFIRLTVVDFYGASQIICVKTDEHYCPTIFYKLSDGPEVQWNIKIGINNIEV
ncbi:PDZ domain-containing protein [Smittium culicis]|uniref:PDZ domain-containing protein n=1 Tax=Smittium culicis TaxID=133412 RepID=A0A1R1YCD5_9FUNG|nr:PDZ domain-containing protein [Smittium culicis]